MIERTCVSVCMCSVNATSIGAFDAQAIPNPAPGLDPNPAPAHLPDPDPDPVPDPDPLQDHEPAHPPNPDPVHPPGDEEFGKEQGQATPLPVPHSCKDYEFSASFAQKSVGPAGIVPQTFLHPTKTHLDAIEKEYDEIFVMRQFIDNLLQGFKQILRLTEKDELPLCFKRLREHAGDYERLELNEEELQVYVGENADEDAKEAVYKFNTMLKQCTQFPAKQDAAFKFIQAKIKDVENESIHVQATEDALLRAKKQLDMLQKWDNDIQILVSEIKSASSHLQSKSRRLATGIHTLQLED